MYYAYANVADDKLKHIKALEAEIGKPLIAVEPVGLRPAEIEAPALDRVKTLEKKLGVTLVAVEGEA